MQIVETTQKKIVICVLVNIVIIIMLPLITFDSFFHGNNTVHVDTGVFDLSTWNHKAVISLEGKWEFYWMKFLTADELLDQAADTLLKIPATWKNTKVHGKQIDGQGYATYRLHVEGATVGDEMVMRISPMVSAYSLFIDHDIIASNGQLSTDKAGFEAQSKVNVAYFTVKEADFDIILQVANFVHTRGGACGPIYIGTSTAITAMHEFITGIQYFIIISMGISMIYFGSICFIAKTKHEFLIIIISALLFLRETIYNSVYFQTIYSELLYSLYVRFEYLITYCIPCLAFLLFRSLYPDIPSKKLTAFIISITLILTCTIMLPLDKLTQFKLLSLIYATTIALYIPTKLVITRNRDIRFPLLSIFVATLGMLHDILASYSIIVSPVRVSSLGLLLFLLVMAYYAAVGYIDARNGKELAEDRLGTLEGEKQILELKYLRAQIHPHFINNSLNTILSISRYDADKARALLVDFSVYLRSSYSLSYFNDMIPISHEIEYVNAYLTLEKARFGNSFLVEYQIQNDTLLIPPLILQPLVENAILHSIRLGKQNGVINISAKVCDNILEIGVCDNGVGLNVEKFQEAISINDTKRKGVGLFNVNQRLVKIYQVSLKIEKRENGETYIYAAIPYK